MDDILDFPDQPAPIKRPLAITLVCLINWAVTLIVLTSAGFVYERLIIKGDFIISMLYMLVCVGACMGVWKMKRWAAGTYIITCIVVLVIMLITKKWLWPMVIPMISTLVIERHFEMHKALLPNR